MIADANIVIVTSLVDNYIRYNTMNVLAYNFYSSEHITVFELLFQIKLGNSYKFVWNYTMKIAYKITTTIPINTVLTSTMLETFCYYFKV